MKKTSLKITRVALLLIAFLIWWLMLTLSFTKTMNLILIIGSPLLIFPAIWIARKILDRQPDENRVDWMITFVHYTVGILLGVSLIRAVITRKAWVGWELPIPQGIGLALVIITGAITLLSMINLALKGLGAPFVIALSKKVAQDWMYAWTRNPMVLAGLALLVSLGIWFRSVLFVAWALVLFAPPLLLFVKVFEERELEIRFGASYLAYKAKTPLFFPRKPRV